MTARVDLFGQMGATFSEDRRHRYKLWREIGRGPVLACIGLNPSTADEVEDDPTIRRVLGFAKRDGFGVLVMLNLFAWRSTDPKGLRETPDPVGRDNDRTLLAETASRRVLCAWGAHGEYLHRDEHVLRLLADRDIVCLGRTRSGAPKHPLYLAADTKFERYP